MHYLANIFSSLLRGVLKLALAVFVLSLLLAILVVVLGVSLWSLLTGRKPAPLAAFSQFRQSSQRYTQGVWPGSAVRGGGNHAAAAADVVDVQAHEVTDAPNASVTSHKTL